MDSARADAYGRAVMRSRSLAPFVSLAIAISALWSIASAAERAAPSLEGMWTGGTLTPFERPPQHADRPLLDKSEIAALENESRERFWAGGHRAGDVGRDNDAFIDNDLKLLPTGQTSLVVDPPNGLVPLRPEAEATRNRNLNTFDSYETMSQWDRCITREPTTMFPVIYNNAWQIIQTPTHIVIVAEMIHDARIIPLDGRAHADARVTLWGGDARGHWEGSTLVVETRNFGGNGWIATGQNAGRARGVPYTRNLRTIERFTRIDRNTLNYEISIEDPEVYSSPWKIAYPLNREDGYRMYEYACHEGNQAVELMLRGARAQEKK